jgi:zinc ribbon protein
MFCPKCGIQNQIEQKYCRGCGHHLAGHVIALKGNIEEATIDIKKGSNLVGIGLIVVGICKLNVLLNFFLGADRIGILFNVLLGLLLAVPLITLGVYRIGRAASSLIPKGGAPENAIDISDEPRNQLPASAATGSVPVPSVTERTTLELKEPERVRK